MLSAGVADNHDLSGHAKKGSTHRQVKIGDERFLQKCKAVYDHSYSPLKANNKIYLHSILSILITI